MEGYVSRSDWYLTDTEHPPFPIPKLVEYPKLCIFS